MQCCAGVRRVRAHYPEVLALLAAVPIALLVVMLLVARVSAAKAAWIALAAALALAFTAFHFESLSASAGENLAGVAAESVFISATILWILLPALAIHELQTRTGALDVLRGALTGAASDSAGRALLIGWFFALFIEGAAGFGTPLAIAAPMLVALGVRPVSAVTMALLGHVSGVAFGAIGTPVLAQAELTTLPATEIARATAFFTLTLAWIPALYVLKIAREANSAPTPFPWQQGLGAALLFGVPFAVAAVWLGPELPTLAGALLGGIAYAALLRRRRPPRAVTASRRPLGRAAAPYLALIALILASRLLPPVKDLATSVTLDWGLYGEYSGSMLPLYHPGTLLFAAFALGAVIQGARSTDLLHALRSAAARLVPALVALVAMLTLSRLMLHTGMISELASAGVQTLGSLWPGVAPSVGALGSFVTGSATASNVLFTNLQEQAATGLALPLAVVLAAQCTGAAIGNAMCPHNIVAGAAAVGAAGREGEILRQTLPACVLLLLAAGGVALAVVHFVPL